MHGHQIIIGVVLPQRRVVRSLLKVHVLEIVGHEQGKLVVQRLGSRGTVGTCAGHQVSDRTHQPEDGLLMFIVIACSRLAASRCAGLDGWMHEGVLMLQVALEHIKQLGHTLATLGKVQVVFHIHATQAKQGVGHEGAQRLMDARVQIHARHGGLGGGNFSNFLGIDLHYIVSCPCGPATARNTTAPGRMHHAPATMECSLGNDAPSHC